MPPWFNALPREDFVFLVLLDDSRRTTTRKTPTPHHTPTYGWFASARSVIHTRARGPKEACCLHRGSRTAFSLWTTDSASAKTMWSLAVFVFLCGGKSDTGVAATTPSAVDVASEAFRLVDVGHRRRCRLKLSLPAYVLLHVWHSNLPSGWISAPRSERRRLSTLAGVQVGSYFWISAVG